MKGYILKRRILFLPVLAVLAVLQHSTLLAKDVVQIGIVKSSNNSYYNQTTQTLINRADGAVRFRIIDIGSDTDQISRLGTSDLVIALGSQATSIVSTKFPKKKLISAYLTAQQTRSSDFKNHQRAVLLDQPLKRYLAFSHLLLNTQNIGLINLERLEIDSSVQKFLLEQEFKLNQYQLDEADNLLPDLRRLIKQNSSLLMLPDQRIYNRNTLKGVLLTTYRGRLPVISYSPAHVKSGALASVYSSPENIGKHLGDLLSEYIKTGSLPREDRLYAKYYTIAINHQVARALRITLPDEGQLRLRLEEVLR